MTALSPLAVVPLVVVAVGLVIRAALRADALRRRSAPLAGAALAVLLVGCTPAGDTSAATGTDGTPSDTAATPVTLEDAARVNPRFFAPRLDPQEAPPELPPFDVNSGVGVQPGTVTFTTFTTPRMTDDMAFHPPFLVELDKQSGDLSAVQRMLTNATMFQPEPGGRYSYNIVDKNGVDGAGFEVTHYVTDERLEVLAGYDLDDLEGGNADLHDFELLDNDNALLMSYRRRQVDLTEFGGSADAVVYDAVFAERTPDGETVWEWDGAEHMDLADLPEEVARAELTAEPPAVADYAHPNAIDVFDDGDLLVSIRHYDCLYRIDKETGDIVWTFGGPNCANNDFAVSGDPYDGFSHQHDATILDDGHILLFDNGNLRTGDDQVSRVVEYAIDEDAMTAELVWSHDDGRYSPIMGSAERLANGNTLIGWGALADPVITEVTDDGERVFAVSVPPGQLVYRVYQGSVR